MRAGARSRHEIPSSAGRDPRICHLHVVRRIRGRMQSWPVWAVCPWFLFGRGPKALTRPKNQSSYSSRTPLHIEAVPRHQARSGHSMNRSRHSLNRYPPYLAQAPPSASPYWRPQRPRVAHDRGERDGATIVTIDNGTLRRPSVGPRSHTLGDRARRHRRGRRHRHRDIPHLMDQEGRHQTLAGRHPAHQWRRHEAVADDLHHQGCDPNGACLAQRQQDCSNPAVRSDEREDVHQRALRRDRRPPLHEGSGRSADRHLQGPGRYGAHLRIGLRRAEERRSGSASIREHPGPLPFASGWPGSHSARMRRRLKAIRLAVARIAMS